LICVPKAAQNLRCLGGRAISYSLNDRMTTQTISPISLGQDKMEEKDEDPRLAAHLRNLSLLAGVTLHDLRTPLHTMVLYLELLRGALAEDREPDPKEERYIDVVASEIQRLERMVELLVGQLQVGASVSGPVDARTIVADLVGFTHPIFHRRHVAVVSRLPLDPVPLCGHRDVIRHSLLQLLLSALETVEGPAKLEVEVAARDGAALLTLTGTPDVTTADARSADRTEAPRASRESSLDLARRSLEREGGTLSMRFPRPREIVITLELPLAAERH